MTVLWLVGAGGHGAVVADAAQASGRWTSIEFFDDRWPHHGGVHGRPVVGDLQGLMQRLTGGEAGNAELLVAIGANAKRLSLSRQLAEAGARLATVVHPTSTLSPSAQIGPGTAVMPGAIVNAGARIGMACIINTRACVEHDNRIGDGVHLCPGVTLAGTVTVHDLAMLGVGSCVTPGITIGHAATVGAGSSVIRDVRDGTTVVGCPARTR